MMAICGFTVGLGGNIGNQFISSGLDTDFTGYLNPYDALMTGVFTSSVAGLSAGLAKLRSNAISGANASMLRNSIVLDGCAW